MDHPRTLLTTGTVGRALKMHFPKSVAARLGIPAGGGIAFLLQRDGEVVVRALDAVRPAHAGDETLL